MQYWNILCKHTNVAEKEKTNTTSFPKGVEGYSSKYTEQLGVLCP